MTDLLDLLDELKEKAEKEKDKKMPKKTKTEQIEVLQELKKGGNIYQKMSELRNFVVSEKIKKTGEAKDKAGKVRNTYYEFSDFVPVIIPFMKEIGLFSFYGVKKDEHGRSTAFLKYFNTEKPEEILEFTMDYLQMESGFMSKIQAHGGTQTFLRRYLYIISLELAENDTIEGVELVRKAFAELKKSGASEDDLKSVENAAKRTFEVSEEKTDKIEGQATLNLGLNDLHKTIADMSKISDVQKLDEFFDLNKANFQSGLKEMFEASYQTTRNLLEQRKDSLNEDEQIL